MTAYGVISSLAGNTLLEKICESLQEKNQDLEQLATDAKSVRHFRALKTGGARMSQPEVSERTERNTQHSTGKQ